MNEPVTQRFMQIGPVMEPVLFLRDLVENIGRNCSLNLADQVSTEYRTIVRVTLAGNRVIEIEPAEMHELTDAERANMISEPSPELDELVKLVFGDDDEQ